MKTRCAWVSDKQICIDYHDFEWGTPVFDDDKLFELLLLECFQAGLSWITILNKRENFREAFDGFDYVKIAKYDEKKIASLLTDKGIIRNRRKIEASVVNARAYLNIQQTYSSFSNYLWKSVNGKPIINHWPSKADVPTTTKESDSLSKNLKKHGFKFVGSTTIYAFMQATGMVMDHTTDCFRYKELSRTKTG